MHLQNVCQKRYHPEETQFFFEKLKRIQLLEKVMASPVT